MNEPVEKILVVDDTPANLTLLDRFLRFQGYEVQLAHQSTKVLESVQADPPDLILLDVAMPEMDGVEVCRRLKVDSRVKDIPVIFISAIDGTGEKVQAFSAGGVDYITKPFQEEEVLARIDTHLKLRKLHKQLEQKNSVLEAQIKKRMEIEAELIDQAVTDPLTQIFNRRHFYQIATRELSRSMRLKRPFSVIMIDIDDFKRVNDTHGHLIGDQVLIEFAKICQENLRQYDILARYGGEEFIVLLPDTTSTQAEHVAERLRATIADTSMKFGDRSVAITISLGVSSFDEEASPSLEQILDQADKGIYASKQAGRNKVTVWEG